jgi:hypothetical protein
MFLDAARDNFSRLPHWIEYGGKAYAFIDSENTYALPAEIDAARFARGRNKILGIRTKTFAGCVGNPTGRRQHCRRVVFSGECSWTPLQKRY